MKTSIQLSDHFTYHKLLRFTLPSIVMMVFTSVYGVVDGFFVSNFAGKTAFASLNLIYPFIMILGGMGFMIGTGGTALVSLILGTGDKEKANRCFSMLIWFTLLFGILLSAVGLLFIRPVSLLLGATPEMLPDCVLYGRIVISFTTAFMLQACANGSSELMSNISASVVSMVYNLQLLRYLGEDGVSAYGVLMYVQFIFIAIYIGYSIGVAPIISYHYGARNYEEMKNMLKKSISFLSCSSIVPTAAAFLFAKRGKYHYM